MSDKRHPEPAERGEGSQATQPEILRSHPSTHLAQDDGSTPPILETWPRLYGAVLLFLAIDIALFYLFTRAFE